MIFKKFILALIFLSAANCSTASSNLVVSTDDNADIYINLTATTCDRSQSRCYIPVDDRRIAIWDDGRHDKYIAAGIFNALDIFQETHPGLKIKSWRTQLKRHRQIEGLWLELESKI